MGVLGVLRNSEVCELPSLECRVGFLCDWTILVDSELFLTCPEDSEL